MRIAIFSDDSLPDSTRVHAKMLHELALELKSNGHEPVILTPGHKAQSRLVVDFIDDIEVWRFRSNPTRSGNKLKRAITESLLSVNAYLAISKKVATRPFDLYINYSPTIFFGPLIRLLKHRFGGYCYLVLRDMFPQWAIDEGLLRKGSLITKYFQFFELFNYKTADCIGVMSDANKRFFQEQYPQFDNVKVLYNWTSLEPYRENISDEDDIRTQLSLENKIIFFYGGNIGHAQDMGNLLRLVNSMKNHPDAHFLFVGQGDEVDLVVEAKDRLNLDNLTYLPSVSQSKYQSILSQVDVGLFSLAKTHKAHNFPGKLLGYMCQSIPILGSINSGNDLVRFIRDEQAGYVYVNGDDSSLFSSAICLLEDSTLRKQTGDNAYRVLCQYFSVKSAAAAIVDDSHQLTVY
ncbi:glycosyltransferase family 4 protein [Vibrio salinus]|uniref:glycosyltransferase family 4 protein n=1 Tax=Vibrio salinus TaxID=2899784 RepID=UPI001E4451F3|nr:glycosyltransferase family 4 protein [Vibrio salinus]MCE0493785.1 glycosyltransferase family 4 protein [Vibrio salinus]